MIVTSTPAPVETSNGIQTKSFKILASRKAFEILSSGLYSNKVRAIVRELGTNAADAHVAANNPAPFKVQLPNRLFPYFQVEDYGTGLSEEDILTLYTTYFDSNKTHSNAFTGCLGLGSKSPFSYTDSFTVESRFDGTLTTYTAYLDADGIPAVSKLDAKPTEEPNGLTVRIPVAADDYATFLKESLEVYQWFAVRPTLVGGEGDLAWTDYKYLFTGDTYKIGRTEQVGYSFLPPTLVMGNVAYPLKAGNVATLRKFKDVGIVLYAPIGAVEITAGREDLAYDERTLAYLRQCGEHLEENLEGHLTAHIANATTLWEAKTRLFTIRRLLDHHSTAAQWGGQKIQPWVDVPEIRRDAGLRPVHAVTVSRTHVSYGRYSSKTYSRPRRLKEGYALGRIEADGKDIWLVDSKTWKADLLRTLPDNKDFYLITGVEDPKFLATQGLDTVVKRTSDIPPAPSGTTAGPKSPKTPRADVYEFTPGQGNAGLTDAARSWTRVNTVPASGVYVVIDRFTPTVTSLNRLQSVYNDLRTLGHPTPIYGVRASDTGKLGPKWVTLEARVKLVVKLHAAEYDEHISTNRYAQNSYRGAEVIRAFASHTKWLNKLRKKHPLRVAVEALKAAQKLKLTEKTSAFTRSRNYVANGESLIPPVCTAEKLADQFHAAYPILEWVDNRVSDERFFSTILAHIALVDAQP